MLIMAESIKLAQRNTQQLWYSYLLKNVGFLLSEKSVFKPSQVMDFLGMVVYRLMQLQNSRGENEKDQTGGQKPSKPNSSFMVDTYLERWNGKRLIVHQPELTIESDASLRGWGAASQDIQTVSRGETVPHKLLAAFLHGNKDVHEDIMILTIQQQYYSL